MREKSCYVFLHTNDFSPYTYFSEHGMLFLSSVYKMVLFCFGRVGYKCMLSSVCRHLAICADLMNCTGGKKIQNFSVSYADHFFPAGSLVQFWTKIIQYYCFRVFHEKNCTA